MFSPLLFYTTETLSWLGHSNLLEEKKRARETYRSKLAGEHSVTGFVQTQVYPNQAEDSMMALG